MTHRGLFIVLEGPDKSGKSTQAELLARALRASKIPLVHTREPGGTSFAEAIRHTVPTLIEVREGRMSRA
jgi:dTMP kinase